jgi:hypothetical protein
MTLFINEKELKMILILKKIFENIENIILWKKLYL